MRRVPLILFFGLFATAGILIGGAAGYRALFGDVDFTTAMMPLFLLSHGGIGLGGLAHVFGPSTVQTIDGRHRDELRVRLFAGGNAGRGVAVVLAGLGLTVVAIEAVVAVRGVDERRYEILVPAAVLAAVGTLLALAAAAWIRRISRRSIVAIELDPVAADVIVLRYRSSEPPAVDWEARWSRRRRPEPGTRDESPPRFGPSRTLPAADFEHSEDHYVIEFAAPPEPTVGVERGDPDRSSIIRTLEVRGGRVDNDDDVLRFELPDAATR